MRRGGGLTYSKAIQMFTQVYFENPRKVTTVLAI